jgi:16S rRNA (adenine1518-N6/adenine1519-N6)-dimethyltransferase
VSETRASLDRLARHGIRPNRELGQNFLIDDNILDVIGRAAELDPADAVVEIGGGLGVLSSYLAQRVRYVHVIETDKRLEPVLRDALAGHEASTSLVIADVMRTRLSGLDPLPGKVFANLP